MTSIAHSKILYVDNDEACCQLVRRMLESDGDKEVTTVCASEQALELIAEHSFDLYIFDQPWRYPLALELCEYVRQDDGKTPILVVSVLKQEIDRHKAYDAGANAYLIKPEDINSLSETVERLFRERDGNGNGDHFANR
jgi:DNA-binding response OmpR family regulator